jgi:hypothetical protein
MDGTPVPVKVNTHGPLMIRQCRELKTWKFSWARHKTGLFPLPLNFLLFRNSQSLAIIPKPLESNMLRQVISSVPARAARSSIRLVARGQAPSRAQAFNQSLISARAIQPAFSRWYSAETEPAKEAVKESAEGRPEAESQEAADPQAVLKKELEAKDAEARDWKVRSIPQAPRASTTYT